MAVTLFSVAPKALGYTYSLHLFDAIIVLTETLTCDYVLHLKTIIIIFFSCATCFAFWWDYYVLCVHYMFDLSSNTLSNRTIGGVVVCLFFYFFAS